MTSLDGDGSPRQDPLHEEVRLAAPADPWLTEAPTSTISDTPTLQDLHTGPAETGPALAPFPRWYHPRRDRRRRRRIVVLLVVCAVFAAGMIALDPFGSDDGDGKATGPAPITATTTASTTTARPAANLPATSAAASTSTSAAASTSTSAAASTAGSTAAAAPAAGDPQVVYEVTARGSKNTGSVTYTDQDGDFVRLNGIPLPWRTTFPGDGQPLNLVLDAQRMGGGDNGPVTCTITVGGKVLSTTTSEGRNAAVLCGGTA